MFDSLLPMIVAIHAVCALVYTILILLRKSHLGYDHIIPIICVPVFGILAAFLIEYIKWKKELAEGPVDLHSFTLDNNPYWKNIISRKEDENIVPLEEAILINNDQTRRRLMLEALYDDPRKYLDVLMVSRNNEDIETAHYATTTIVKIQRGFQLEVQKLEAAVNDDPDDIALLDQYLDVLEKYIESGVLEDHLLKRQRIHYAMMLQKKLNMKPDDKTAMIKSIHNSIKMDDLQNAAKFAELLKASHPDDEDTWIESIKVSVESQNSAQLRKTLAEIRNLNIDWSKQGRELVEPWLN